MNLIDARKHFTNKDISSFKTGLNESDLVDILLEKANIALTLKVENLKTFFTDDSIAQYINDDNEIISFVCNDNCLQFAGQDYKWYTATVRNKPFARLDKLFEVAEVKTEKRVKKETDNNKFIKVGIATLTDEKYENVSIFEGTKQQCIAFINKEYAIREIRSRFAENTRVCIQPGENPEWKTLDELALEGVIEL